MNEDKVLYVDGETILSYRFVDSYEVVIIEQGEVNSKKDYVFVGIEHLKQILADYDNMVK